MMFMAVHLKWRPFLICIRNLSTCLLEITARWTTSILLTVLLVIMNRLTQTTRPLYAYFTLVINTTMLLLDSSMKTINRDHPEFNHKSSSDHSSLLYFRGTTRMTRSDLITFWAMLKGNEFTLFYCLIINLCTFIFIYICSRGCRQNSASTNLAWLTLD